MTGLSAPWWLARIRRRRQLTWPKALADLMQLSPGDQLLLTWDAERGLVQVANQGRIREEALRELTRLSQEWDLQP